MTKSRGQRDEWGKGTIDSVDWNGERQTLETLIQFVKFVFFMYDQRPSVSNRDLATVVRTPHERRYMHCVGFICLST